MSDIWLKPRQESSETMNAIVLDMKSFHDNGKLS